MQRLLDIMRQVEEEMHRIGFWRNELTELDETFEAWLQLEFLPETRRQIAANELYKQKSMVGVKALRQYDYHSTITKAHPLMHMLFDFDRVANEINGIKE